MFLIHLLYALFIGLGIAWLFGLALGTRGPWNSFIWFFFVIFLFFGAEVSGLLHSVLPDGECRGCHS